MPNQATICTQATSASEQPTTLTDRLLLWLRERLYGRGITLPTCKRLSCLASGLLLAQSVTRMHLTAALVDAPPCRPSERSIARRIERSLGAAALDPERILPPLLATVLPDVLQAVLAEHDRRLAADPCAHGNWFPLALAVDETSVAEHVHILCASLAYQGTALPLMVTTWEQNTPLTDGEYWRRLSGVLQAVREVFPPALQDHLVLVADRGYGVPRMLDTVNAFDWHWVLRVQRDRRVLLQNGQVVTAQDLAQRPGTHRFGAARLERVLADDEDAASTTSAPNAASEPVAAFKDADWRACQVIGSWLPRAKEPWLLVTNLPLRHDAVQHYAQRWGIERQCKAWKSQGFHLEDLQRPTVARVRRVLTALVIATWWTVGAAIAHLQPQLVHAAAAPSRPPCAAGRRPSTGITERRQLAERSLLTHGLLLLHGLGKRAPAPPIEWSFPFWEVPTWSALCFSFGSTT